MPCSLTVEEKLTTSWPPSNWQDITLLLAVSGGCDSVALLRAMLAIQKNGTGKILVGHFNHCWRGKDSEADQRFVESLCEEHKIECYSQRADTTQHTHPSGDSLEAAARRARYEFLQKTAHQTGARYVVTAHTADDQVETILHRIARGTGISGLAGMRRARALDPTLSLLRPLLSIRREELEDYLKDLKQPFRQDASNTDVRFTRNRIRHRLLPILESDFNPTVQAAILRLGSLAEEAQEAIDSQIDKLIDDHVSINNSREAIIQLIPLRSTPNYLVRELFIKTWKKQNWPQQSMGYEQWEQLARLSQTPVDEEFSPKMFPGEVTVKKQGEKLVLSRPV